MKYPRTREWDEAWKWLKAEMEDMIITIAQKQAGWRIPK